MITMKGKYNFANIMIDEIDEATKEQIQTFLNHPAFADTYIAIMPDCHAGKGAVVGFTMQMNNYIIPNLVGVDIGCGMLHIEYPLQTTDLTKLDEFIKKNIPSGFAINSTYPQLPDLLEYCVRYICEELKIDSEKALKALGSLGGGNHFLECGINKAGNICVTIHTGSRNFGLKVATHYQNKAKEILKKYFIQEQYRDLEFLLVDSIEGQNYLRDLAVAQEFAHVNRMEIMKRLSSHFEKEPLSVVESVHNFIGSGNIIRKGATPAYENDLVIILFQNEKKDAS